jgi:hypothetical protein
MWPHANLGVRLGDDVVLVDIDSPEALERLRRLTDGQPLFPVTPTVKTGRGWHIYLQAPGKVRSFDPVEGVNVKTGNSIAVVPPSLHWSGTRYSYARGRVLGELELAPSPPWLLALFQARPRSTPRRPGEPIPRGRRHATLLSIAGSMRRQGATEVEILAALTAANERCQPPLERQEVNSIARSMSAYEPDPDPILDLGGPTQGDELRQAQQKDLVDPDNARIAGGSNVGEWEVPIPLSRVSELPAFPVEGLPEWLREWAMAEAEATQTPVDMAATLTLAAIATLAASRVEVEPVSGWREPLNLFIACAMDPGSRKSAVHRDVTAPIIEYEHLLLDEGAAVISEAASLRRIALAHLAKTEKAAASAKSDDDRQALEEEARVAVNALDRLAEPAPPRLFTDDATPEALATLLYQNKGRMSVLSAEGGIFDLMAGRYSAGIPNLDVYLKGHAGDPLRVDRRGRPTEFVDRPALTVGVAVQPFVLVKAAKLEDFGGRGLFDRFLFALPPGNVGYRRTNPQPMPDLVRSTYSTNLRALASTLEHGVTVLHLSEAASAALIAWRDELEPRRRPDSDLGHVQGWSSKLDGATVRLAGILHVADAFITGLQQPISERHMVAAINIARYFIGHALAVFDRMGADPTVDRARRVAAWATTHHLARFSKRDCHLALRPHFKRAAELDPALAVLCDHGWIRSVPALSRPGRRSNVYELNPTVLAQYEQNTQNPVR